jgi:SWI/SNF-related matrix-associated actin-dependent regulator 1 of chromatin subfamily A
VPSFGNYKNGWGKGRNYSGEGASARKSETKSNKLLTIELAENNQYGIRFEGFYDNDIKEIIKNMPHS